MAPQISQVQNTPRIPGLADFAVIGRGGSSVVYRAWENNLGRQVAVKIGQADPDTVEQFRAEARRTASLAPEAPVVEVFRLGITPSGQPFLVLEYLAGGSLSDRIRTNGAPLSVPEVLDVGIDVADALNAAHQRGILHCDVKPANVLLTCAGRARLADFGASTVLRSDATDIEHGALSVAHASPEQLRHGVALVASDLYSLGSTLYEGLCGRAPFDRLRERGVAGDHRPGRGSGARDSEEQWWRDRVISGPRPRIVRSDLPDGLAELIDQTLHLDPERRPGSAAEVAARLRTIRVAARRPEPVSGNSPDQWVPGLLASSDTVEPIRGASYRRAGRLTHHIGPGSGGRPPLSGHDDSGSIIGPQQRPSTGRSTSHEEFT